MLTIKDLARRILATWEADPRSPVTVTGVLAVVKPERLLWAVMHDDPTYRAADLLAALIEMRNAESTADVLAKADEIRAIVAGLIATAEPRVLAEIDALQHPETE